MPKRSIRGRNFSVKIDIDAFDDIDPRKIVNNRFADELGSSVKEDILDLTAVGKSPVKNVGRYKPYAAQRKGSGYPETGRIRKKYPGKKTRPVNLRLDGTFLNELDWKKVVGGIDFGWLDPGDFIKKLIEAHQEGKHPDIPRRQVLPTGSRDDFTASIRRSIINLYNSRIRDILKKQK